MKYFLMLCSWTVIWGIAWFVFGSFILWEFVWFSDWNSILRMGWLAATLLMAISTVEDLKKKEKEQDDRR